jgi:hypothetical protein
MRVFCDGTATGAVRAQRWQDRSFQITAHPTDWVVALSGAPVGLSVSMEAFGIRLHGTPSATTIVTPLGGGYEQAEAADCIETRLPMPTDASAEIERMTAIYAAAARERCERCDGVGFFSATGAACEACGGTGLQP